MSTGADRPRLLLAVTHPMTADLLMRGQLTDLWRHGFEVAVAASPGPQLDQVRQREGVRAVAVPMRREPAPLHDLAALIGAVKALRRYRPHLVNAATPKAGLLFSAAARLTRVPRRLYTVRGLRLETVGGLPRRVLATSERTAVACAHRVLCVSDSLRHRYAGLGLAPEAKLAVIGDGSSNGVDLERFRPRNDGDTDLDDLRRRLRLPDGGPVIGFVGRFTHDKGFGELATAYLDRIRPRLPTTRLLLVGDYESGDAVPEAVRQRLEGEPRVVSAGFVPDTAPYYRLMDVLAFPSHREGFPNAPLEAAATGLPVAGFAATGTVDAVVDGETGRLVPVGDADSLAEALIAYLADPDLARLHGAAGRRRAAERFSRRRVWDAWRELYVAELATAGLPAPLPRGAGKKGLA